MKIKPLIVIAIGFIILFSDNHTVSAENAAKSDVKYTFTDDQFTHNTPAWNSILRDMKGKPNLTYLEIGVYEGRSFFWVMDNILTHPSSKAIAIDTFQKYGDNDPEKIFLRNLRRSGHSLKVRTIKGFSQQKLRELKLNSIDLIYVDGDHGSKSVLMDALLSWDLLKNGGIMIFDDYKWNYLLPMEMRPAFALDVFQTILWNEFTILFKGYQLIVQKTIKSCDEKMGFIKKEGRQLACSQLGQYIYYWKPQKLVDTSNGQETLLNKQEISLIISRGKFPEACFVPCRFRYPAACCGEVHLRTFCSIAN